MKFLHKYFGLGKHVVSDPPPQSVQAQGVFDVLRVLDSETVAKIQKIIRSIDADKISAVMDTITVSDDGWIHVRLDIGIKKENQNDQE